MRQLLQVRVRRLDVDAHDPSRLDVRIRSVFSRYNTDRLVVMLHYIIHLQYCPVIAPQLSPMVLRHRLLSSAILNLSPTIVRSMSTASIPLVIGLPLLLLHSGVYISTIGLQAYSSGPLLTRPDHLNRIFVHCS